MKQAFAGELDGKLGIASQPVFGCMLYVSIYIYIYIYICCMSIYQRVHGRFCGFNLKGNSCPVNFKGYICSIWKCSLVMETAADLETKERKLDTHATCMFNNCQ